MASSAFGQSNWLIARRSALLLVHIRFDQARIDRKTLATNQTSRNALRHHALKYPSVTPRS